MMDAELIARLNTLCNPIYPHPAQWIELFVPQDTGHILEIGPFSGGIINSLLAPQPTLQGLIALSEENAARVIRKSFALPILVPERKLFFSPISASDQNFNLQNTSQRYLKFSIQLKIALLSDRSRHSER